MISSLERAYHDLYASNFDLMKLKRRFNSHTKDSLWRDLNPYLVGKKALDVGCGVGFDTVLLAKSGFHVTAVDISQVCLDKAELLAKEMGVEENCSFRLVDLNTSGIDGTYDIIFGRAVLHHLTFGPMHETLGMLRANLLSGGKIILIESLDRNPLVVLNRKVFDVYDRTPTERPINLSGALTAFRMASLYVSHREYYLVSTMAHFFRNVTKHEFLFRSSRQTLSRIDSTLMKAFPPLNAFAWICMFVAQSTP